MRLYALTELHDPEAIELFITEEDAKRALEDCLRDEPDWSGLLRVEEIAFAGMLQVRQLKIAVVRFYCAESAKRERSAINPL